MSMPGYIYMCTLCSIAYKFEFTSQELCGSVTNFPNCRAEIHDVILFLDNQIT